MEKGSLWAAAAAKGLAPQASSGSSAAWEPRMVVSARRVREVLVCTASESIRIPVEVVAAVNKALGKDEAVAAQRLQSGDTMVIFAETATAYKAGEDWISKAFGGDTYKT